MVHSLQHFSSKHKIQRQGVTCTGSGMRMEAPRSATPERNVLMSHVSCLPVSRSSLPGSTNERRTF